MPGGTHNNGRGCKSACWDVADKPGRACNGLYWTNASMYQRNNFVEAPVLHS
jgi:hypothetical protein